jgi:hypothetical protein
MVLRSSRGTGALASVLKRSAASGFLSIAKHPMIFLLAFLAIEKSQRQKNAKHRD